MFGGRLAKHMLHGLPPSPRLYWRALRGDPLCFSFELSTRSPAGGPAYCRPPKAVPQLEDEAVLAFFREKRDEGMPIALIAGGEPYLRRALLAKIAETTPTVWILTSGTVN